MGFFGISSTLIDAHTLLESSRLLAEGWMGGLRNGLMGGWVDGWFKEWADGWMGGWVDVDAYICVACLRQGVCIRKTR